MYKLIALLTFTTLSSALQCRDGFFIGSDAFDVNRSSPAPLTCPSTAEAGCVRFEVEGTFRTGSQDVPCKSKILRLNIVFKVFILILFFLN